MTSTDEASEGARDGRRAVDAIVADPALKQRLVDALLEELEQKERQHLWNDRIKPFLAGLSSAAVILLAFLIPSVQELWDRYETRSAIDVYAGIGRRLTDDGKYTAAEEPFDRALELAGSQRVDLFEAKMKARVGRIAENPTWRGEAPEELKESDFLYLLELDRASGKAKERAATLTGYGASLAGTERWQEAESRLREAIDLDPASSDAHVNLANVLADLRNPRDAEAEYRRAVELDAGNAIAHYDLGVQLAENGRHAEAETEFRAYTALVPEDAAGFVRLAEELRAQNELGDARVAYETARRLDPSNVDARAGLASLGARRD